MPICCFCSVSYNENFGETKRCKYQDVPLKKTIIKMLITKAQKELMFVFRHDQLTKDFK